MLNFIISLLTCHPIDTSNSLSNCCLQFALRFTLALLLSLLHLVFRISETVLSLLPHNMKVSHFYPSYFVNIANAHSNYYSKSSPFYLSTSLTYFHKSTSLFIPIRKFLYSHYNIFIIIFLKNTSYHINSC